MAITMMRKPPAAGRLAVISAVRDLSPAEDRLGGAHLDVSEPIALFRLGLDQISSASSLDHAEFVGWRYLLEGAGQRNGMADVAQAGSASPRFANLARNEQADLLLRAAHLAEHVAEDLEADCEARILTVPSLYLSAVWLVTDPPIFIPFLDVLHPIRSTEDVKVRPDFLGELVERAEMARNQRGGRAAAGMAP